MGFFDGLGRFMTGKPVFEDEGAEKATERTPAAPAQDQSKTSLDSRGYKIIPKIEIKPLKTSRNGDQMISNAWITNGSDEVIRIDYVAVAGQKQVFNRELAPRQGHDFVIYRGPVKRDDHDDHARIVYRLVRSDDLFEEEYHVEYHRESDGGYLLEEFHEDGPTRDI